MRITWWRYLLVLTLLMGPDAGAQATRGELYGLQKCRISFVSDAPMERIQATCTLAVGVIDRELRTFAIRVPIRDFEGFNSRLQREHFNENYLESGRYPYAVFEGRIIEAIDFAQPGTHAVRAKGRFELHGISEDRIIACEIVVTADGVRVKSTFDIVLADHDIRIPRIVQQKISAVARVDLDMLFAPGKVPGL
jgi:hypothetical protein